MREKILLPLKSIKLPIIAGALMCFLVALITDLASKSWALEALAHGKRIPILSGWLDLEITANAGAALSLGAGQTWQVTLLSVGITIIIVVFLLFNCSRWDTAILLALVIGGAVGNIHDRFFRPPGAGSGAVVDFINYHGWFVGNVADIYIVVGIILFIAITLLRPDEHKIKHQSDKKTNMQCVRTSEGIND